MNINELLNNNEECFLYNVACGMFFVGNYKDALKIYELLLLINDSNLLYFKSVASCYQNLKNYRSAILNYQYVYSCFPEQHLDCLYYMGYCFYKLDDYHMCRLKLNQFIQMNTSESEYIKQSKILLEIIGRL